jgi:hypothetical protein
VSMVPLLAGCGCRHSFKLNLNRRFAPIEGSS